MATRAKKSQGGRSQSRGKRSGRSPSRRAASGRGGAARRSATTGTRGRGRAKTTARRGGTGTGSRRRRGATTRPQDAVALLKAEHDQVNQLFEEFERATRSRGGNGGSRKTELAAEICRQLTIHAAIEEEIFYPAANDAVQDDELVPEATVEHQSAKELIAKIERMDPEDELFDATVTVLGEYIRHHVKEEQNELFPQVKRAGLDLRALGDQLRERRAQLEMR
jgi:hemerythrin-like domain-containing protein